MVASLSHWATYTQLPPSWPAPNLLQAVNQSQNHCQGLPQEHQPQPLAVCLGLHPTHGYQADPGELLVCQSVHLPECQRRVEMVLCSPVMVNGELEQGLEQACPYQAACQPAQSYIR